MDSTGAWVLLQWIQHWQQSGLAISLQKFHKEHEALLELIKSQGDIATAPRRQPLGLLAHIGKATLDGYQELLEFCSFTGEIFVLSLGWLRDPLRIRWHSISSGLQATGFNALIIVGLLSFLIGVVLAYQMGLQLINYGANIFVVDLLGISLFREFGPLITAIILAGRTGSSYAAQIGTMKLNEEVDVLRTLGLSPTELLVLPKFFALIIALPLLAIWADIFGVVGGMVMSKGLLDISYVDFIKRFNKVVELREFYVGLIKTPVFAALIASIGCFQGFQVHGSATSVGRHTTTSVVQGIFMIIVADAGFSVLFGSLGI